MSTASLQPHGSPGGDESKAAPRAVVRLLRSARAGQVVSEGQLERIRALHPELVAQLEAVPAAVPPRA